MQKTRAMELMHIASLLLLSAAASALFIPFEQTSSSLSANVHLLISAALCAFVLYFAKPFNDILIQRPYLPQTITLSLLAVTGASIGLGLPHLVDILFLLETIALAFSVISHISIVRNTTFRQQRAMISMGITGGLFLSGIMFLPFQAWNIDFDCSILIITLLALQSAISIACRHWEEPSPLQLPSSESKSHRDSAVHFGAPLADGFLLGFLPASLFTTRASIDASALAWTLLAAGCLLLFVFRSRKRSFRTASLSTESPEQAQKRQAGFFKVIPIALSLFFGASPVIDPFLVGLHLFIYTWYFSLLCSSLTERGHFLNISIFFILGKYGTTFALGFLTAGISCCLPELFGASELLGNELRVVLGIFIIEGFCAISTRKGTMVDTIEEAAHSSETGIASAEKQRSRWRDRVDAIATAYDLTSRQQEVFLHLARGRGAQFIADELCVSLPTAKSHIYNIYIKLGVHSRQELLDLVDLGTNEFTEQRES